MNDRSSMSATTESADALDRLFARLFVVIAALSWTGLLLAEFSVFRPAPLLVLGATASGIGLLLVNRAFRRAPTRPTPRSSVLTLIVLVLLSAGAVLPPGDPLVAGADESVYLSLGSGIRVRGAILSTDPLLTGTPQDDWPRLFARDRHWPERLNRFEGGVQIEEGEPIVQPSFFHLLPVWIAGAQLAAGTRAGGLIAPAFAILAVAAIFLAARRLTSPVAAAAATALVATSLGEAWCGRQPLSELPTQYFVWCGIWFLTWWTGTGRVAPAVLAGVAFGLGAFTRIDALMLVTPAVVAVLAARWWYRGIDRGLVSCAVALGVSTGHAMLHALTIAQPYTLRIGRHFVRDRSVPIAIVAAALLAVFAALLVIGRRRQWRIAGAPRYLGLAIAVLTIAFSVRQPQRLMESPLLYLLTGPGLVLAGFGLIRWSRRSDEGSWLVLLLALVSAAAYLDIPRDLPDMPGVFRRTLPVLLPVAALLVADLLTPRDVGRTRSIVGALVLGALGVVGIRHTVPILGQSLPFGSRDGVAAIARKVPPSALVVADRGLPGHLALALDFAFGRSSLAVDFALGGRDDAGPAALKRLLTRTTAARRAVFLLAGPPSGIREALPADWTAFEVSDASLSYTTLERRRGAWPAAVQNVHHQMALYQLLPPDRQVALPVRIDVGSVDLALWPAGWLPAEVMLSVAGRWTGASARLRFPAVQCPPDAPLVVRIRAATLRPSKVTQPRVRLSVNGVGIGELAPSDSAFRVYALGLPSAAVRQVCTAPFTVGIETGTFIPARDAGSPDARELGLAVDWIEVAPDAGHE